MIAGEMKDIQVKWEKFSQKPFQIKDSLVEICGQSV